MSDLLLPNAETPATPLMMGVLLYHEVNELEAVTVYSVLKTAELVLTETSPDALPLSVFTVAKARNSVQTAGAMTITPLYAFASVPPTSVLIVPGGAGVDKALRDRAVTGYLEAVGGDQQVLASVSSGALLLGKLGFLRNQIVSIHPALADRLEDYEILRVSDDRLVKNESGIWSARGALAGVDLGLELLRHFFSDEVVARTAERLAIETVQPALF